MRARSTLDWSQSNNISCVELLRATALSAKFVLGIADASDRRSVCRFVCPAQTLQRYQHCAI